MARSGAPGNDRRLIFLLGAMSMLGPLGIDTYLPAFPALAETLAVSPLVVQQTLSAYTFCFAISMLFSGMLSDCFGRRRVLLFSLSVFFVSNLAAAAARSAEVLIAVRALQGLAGGAGAVLARAIVQDLFVGVTAQRAMARITLVFSIAPAIAPIAGGWILMAAGWPAIFIFLGVFGVLLLLACFAWLEESLPMASRKPLQLRRIGHEYLHMGSDRGFLLQSASIGLMYCGYSLYIGAAAPFVMDILGRSATGLAWLFVPLIGGTVIGSLCMGRLPRSFLERYAIPAGMAIAFVATLINIAYTAALDAALPWAVMPLTLYSFGLALAAPGMITGTLRLFPTARGMAASVQSFTQMAMFSMISGVASPWLFHSAFSLALGHSAGIGLGIALWCLSRYTQRDLQGIAARIDG